MRLGARGFTLIELMIVVAIIGVLAAVAFPAYQNYVARAQVMEGLAMTRSLKDAMAATYYATGSFPTSNAEAGVGTDSSFSSKYVTSVEVVAPNGGVHTVASIVVTFGGQVRSEMAGKRLALHAIPGDGGGIVWACGNHWTNMNAIDSRATLWLRITAPTHDTLGARFRPAECRDQYTN